MDDTLRSFGFTGAFRTPLGYIVLALIVVMFVMLMVLPWYHKKEGYMGYPLFSPQGVTGALTSGATQSQLGQSFTQPGQGERTTVHIPELREAIPNLFEERMVGMRQEPDLYSVGSLLDDYTRANDGVSYERAEESRLVSELYG